MEKHLGLIYKHTIKNTGKSYIGLTKHTMEQRLKGHIAAALKGSTLEFHEAIQLHGKDNIISEILEDDIYSEDELKNREIYYIDMYNTWYDGYNMTPGGEMFAGHKLVIDLQTNKVLHIKVEDFDRSKYKNYMDDKISVVDKLLNKYVIIDKSEFLKNRENYITNYDGNVCINDNGKNRIITSEEFKNGNFKSIHHNKGTYKDYNGNTYHIDKNSQEIKDLNLVGVNKGFTVVKDKDNNKLRVPVDDERIKTGELRGINAGKKLTYLYKRINIYNSDNELQFECFGNFCKTCEENNLPGGVLAESFKNNGKPIYVDLKNKSTISRLTNLNFYKFKGWYALLIEE